MMRLNDDFFNEPEKPESDLESKFQVVSKYSDMPDAYRKVHNEMYRNALKMIKASEVGDNHLAAVQYSAFLSVQIASLQQEIKQLYTALEHFAKALDNLEERM
jgi:hypothetical protein